MFEMLSNLARKVFGDSNERELNKIRPAVARINDLEPQFKALTDEQLVAKTAEFKQRLANGAKLDDILPEAFATVREASSRVQGMRHYDVQLIGGMVLHQGRISEMKTGEGKTLVATLPLYLNALEGKGVHLVTVNDYLASRDADWMGRVYKFLGMSVGKILSEEKSNRIKREAYAADITYGTNNEFGFDYLRDNMKFSLDEYVQRGHHFGIVDEVDSILIDEARTPLIISGPMNVSVDKYAVVDGVIPLLQQEIHFQLDEKNRSVTLTDEGISRVEERLGITNLYDVHNMEVLHHVSQSLKAHHLFRRDQHYVVRGNQVVIVDEFTGRLMHGRRWSDGLHQAVEAKEKVTIQQESQVYATITFQNLFRMYKKLAGMTGTADTEAAEFAAIYNLDTIVIPTHRKVARLDHDDIIFKTVAEKFRAVAKQIDDSHAIGQPVLVGTTSVEKSEMLSRMLKERGVTHEVLNAKNHAREALIVAQAGRKGAVTISTNMAGRGTDIKLGGNPEEMAKEFADPVQDPAGYEEHVKRFEIQCKAEAEEVRNAGGLYIVGTERHESRRVDNQLRGRSGRQGDPGASRFYLSLQDDLLRIFSSDKITVWMERMGLPDDEPIEHRWITRAVENAQKKVEAHHFNSRKSLLEYDDVMNYQRKGVYETRRRALAGEGIDEMIDEAAVNCVEDILEDYAGEMLHPEHWNLKALRENMGRVFGIQWEETDAQLRDLAREDLRKRMLTGVKDLVTSKREASGGEAFREFARMMILQYTDQLWKDHLLAMDRLRQGVSLRGYGQRNPLLEYKKEAFQMFMMMSAMRDESLLTQICAVDPGLIKASAEVASKSTARKVIQDDFELPEEFGGGAPDEEPDPVALPLDLPLPVLAPEHDEEVPLQTPNRGIEAYQFAIAYGVKRNDPCPCGSGLKFKKCCFEAGGGETAPMDGGLNP